MKTLSYKHSSAVREFLRDRQRAYRAKKKAAATQFKPRILRFELCSACHSWHPTQAMPSNGAIIRVPLDFYHQSEIDSIRRNFDILIKLAQGEESVNAMSRCIQWQMREEGVEDEQSARENCELLFKDPQARERWEDKIEQDNMLQTQMEICIRSRVELYKESQETAKTNCTLILNDDLYRHFPVGLIPPLDIEDLSHGQIVTGGSVPEIEEKKNIMTCFYHQVEVEKMEPEEAMRFCSGRARGELSEEREKMYQQTVGDVYGKTKEQILKEQAAEKEQDGFTVGNLFGQSREERLKKQRESKAIEASSSPTATLKGRGSLPRRRRKPFFTVDELSDHTALVNEREERAREEHRKLVAAQSKKKLGEGSE